MSKKEVLKYSSVKSAIDAYNTAMSSLADGLDNLQSNDQNVQNALNDLATNDQQVQDAIDQLDSAVASATAYATVTFQRGFAGDDLTVKPEIGNGEVEGDVSYYLKDGDTLQLIRFETGVWNNFLEPITSKKYVDKKGSLSNIAALMNYTPNPSGDWVNVLGFYQPGDEGGGIYYYDYGKNKSSHNGGSIIDPTHSVNPGTAGWWTDENATNGCWVTVNDSEVDIRQFGVIPENDTGFIPLNNSTAIQAAIDTGKKITGAGDYYVGPTYTVPAANVGDSEDYTACIDVPPGMEFIGKGRNQLTLRTASNTTIFSQSATTELSFVEISSMKLVGSTGPVNASDNVAVEAARSRNCGIRFGHELASGSNIFFQSKISDLLIEKFGMNAIRCPFEFENLYERIEADECLGHVFYIEGTTNTEMKNCRVRSVTSGRAAYRFIRKGLLNSCNGTSSSSPSDHYWAWFGNENAGQEVEQPLLPSRSFEGGVLNCNMEHWQEHAVILAHNSSCVFEITRFRQNGTELGVIVRQRGQQNIRMKFSGCNYVTAAGYLNGAAIESYREIDVFSDFPLDIYSTNYETTVPAASVSGAAGYFTVPQLRSSKAINAQKGINLTEGNAGNPDPANLLNDTGGKLLYGGKEVQVRNQQNAVQTFYNADVNQASGTYDEIARLSIPQNTFRGHFVIDFLLYFPVGGGNPSASMGQQWRFSISKNDESNTTTVSIDSPAPGGPANGGIGPAQQIFNGYSVGGDNGSRRIIFNDLRLVKISETGTSLVVAIEIDVATSGSGIAGKSLGCKGFITSITKDDVEVVVP